MIVRVNSVDACALEVFVSSVQLGENLHGHKEINNLFGKQTAQNDLP